MGKLNKMKFRTLILLIFLLTFSCLPKTEKQVDKLSIELIESGDFNKIADKLKDTEKVIIDSLIDKYMDSLKINGDTTFLRIKIDFEKHKFDNDGYLY